MNAWTYTLGSLALLTLAGLGANCGGSETSGTPSGECQPGAKDCLGNIPRSCSADGKWSEVSACAFVCSAGECIGQCAPGAKECLNNAPRTCNAMGAWEESPACSNLCINGACTGECAPSTKECSGNTPRNCDSMGQWVSAPDCPFLCSAGECIGECVPGAKDCIGKTPRTCDAKGVWTEGLTCGNNQSCANGVCEGSWPSCSGLANACGAAGNEKCCALLGVPGGTFNRLNDAATPATVADFQLDRFEVTVGRFRQFVNAYPGNKPAAGSGAHPMVPGSGWDDAWTAQLPADQDALRTALICDANFATWSDVPAGTENRPINCLSWYEAFAFCIWDGGRLASEAEWNYAAAGGAEQRVYPWSNPPDSMTIDGTYAAYACTGDGSMMGQCAFSDILKVGFLSPKGDGKWGHADFAGNVWEFVRDTHSNVLPLPCDNCINLNAGERVLRGGAWDHSANNVNTLHRLSFPPDGRSHGVGVRCVKAL